MRIRSLGVIDDAVVELSPGFTAVTGETGAGKTMVVTSLGLLLGGRADPALVRVGAKAAVVEGRITRVRRTPRRRVRAEEAGGEIEDGALLISRTVSAEGRSRAHLGGRSVPVGLLAELADDLVAVHGQTDQQGLLKPARQRQALDRYAGDACRGPAHRVRGGLPAAARGRHRARRADHPGPGARPGGGSAALRPRGDRRRRAAARRGHRTRRRGRAARPRRGARLGRHRSRTRRSRATPEDPEGVDATTLVAAAAPCPGRRTGPRPGARRARRPDRRDLASCSPTWPGSSPDTPTSWTPTRCGSPPSRSGVPRSPQLTRKYGEDITAVLAWAEEGAARLDRTRGRRRPDRRADGRARRAARRTLRPRRSS